MWLFIHKIHFQGDSAMNLRPQPIIVLAIVVIALPLHSCIGLIEPTPVIDENLPYTQAAETLMAQLTLYAPTATSSKPTVAPSNTAQPTSTKPPTLADPPTYTPTLEATETTAPTETPTETATLSPTPVATLPLTVEFFQLYKDNFSSGGWVEQRTDNFRMHHVNDGYRVYVNPDHNKIWSVRSPEYFDVRVETEAFMVEGPDTGFYGVICRFENGSNYYAMVIGENGYYGIGKQKDGTFRFLAEGTDDKNVINTDGSLNVVQGDCVGEDLVLHVNNVQLLHIQDSDFLYGAVGVSAGTKAEERFVAQFNEFVVYTP